MPKRCRRLVVDADVVGSATETKHPVSSACRRFLMTMLEVRHCVVITDDIKAEWRRHQTKFSRTWLRRRYARKLVRDDYFGPNVHFRAGILAFVPVSKRSVVAKDLHLVEAAIATDFLVASQDETVRSAFRCVSVNVQQLQQVVWVNPTIREERPILWLRSGARPEAHRQLGD